jgi:phosphoenolpyruvate phosphomutase
MSVEKDIASVDEVFRLQNVQELKSSEKKYLPTTNAKKRKALVLGAAKGDFGAMVENKPKCMLPVGGKPVLTWQVEAFNRAGIKDVAVVRGYRKEAVDLAGLRTFDNDQWATTGELASLYAARDMLNDDVVISYGDVVFDDFILQNLVHQENNAVTIAADASWKLRDRKDAKRDLVSTQGVLSPIGDSQCNLVKMGSDVPEAEVTGEFIGLMYLNAEGARTVATALDHLAKNEPETLAKGNLDTLFRRLAAQGQKVSVVHTYGHWRDLDTQADLVEA